MAEQQTPSAEPVNAEMTGVIPWSEAERRMAEASSFWVATTRADGRPHVRPVLAVWVDGALHSTSSPAAAKARHLARDPRCTVTTQTDGLDLVVDGTVEWVTDESALQRIADAYRDKYAWPVTVRDGAFHAAYGAPTAGPPPYEAYVVRPTTVLGLGTDERYAAQCTRWRF